MTREEIRINYTVCTPVGVPFNKDDYVNYLETALCSEIDLNTCLNREIKSFNEFMDVLEKKLEIMQDKVDK